MKEHNLPEIARLYLEMENVNGKIKEARERAPDLLVMYGVDEFEATDKHGNLAIHNTVDAAFLIGLLPSDVRSATITMIEELMQAKIMSIKLKLKKLGVRLEEPAPPLPEPLRLTGPKIRRVK